MNALNKFFHYTFVLLQVTFPCFKPCSQLLDCYYIPAIYTSGHKYSILTRTQDFFHMDCSKFSQRTPLYMYIHLYWVLYETISCFWGWDSICCCMHKFNIITVYTFDTDGYACCIWVCRKHQPFGLKKHCICCCTVDFSCDGIVFTCLAFELLLLLLNFRKFGLRYNFVISTRFIICHFRVGGIDDLDGMRMEGDYKFFLSI